jgi:hypothetical protein
VSTPDLDRCLGTGLDTCLDPGIFDDLFQACAFEAFVTQAACDGGWPDPERTRRRAYNLYESALAEANALRTAMPTKAA